MRISTKVIIADQHEIFRKALVAHLQETEDIEVIRECEYGDLTVEVCLATGPDILVLDLRIDRVDGLSTLRQLRNQMPSVKTLVLSSDCSCADAEIALANGASGFLPKISSAEQFATVIRAISSGYSCFPSSMFDKVTRLRRNILKSGNPYCLTERELEILHASWRGCKTRDLAEKLSLSVRTVEAHRHAIYRKTDCSDLVHLCRRLGFD